ncbi:uncharacterized protein LOC106636447 [Copidosoma floridanum]|uniref:uncharacterized protein LOC106636447 n=1 Tax=Copidosoma floridanum TaxID=29053 RepID=UPI0006C9CE5D|nr:uncharacterized protein LOC106636447 [Copidosoma floridanum]
MLLDASVHAFVINSEVLQGNVNEPIASSSELEWLLSGPTSISPRSKAQDSLVLINTELCDLEQLVQKFWEIVKPPSLKRKLNHGRYIISFPFKDNPTMLIEQRSSMGFEEATSGRAVSLHCAEEDQLITLLKRFWKIEELPADLNSLWTGDERACEQHFIDTHYRDSTGRYVVRLPFKTDPKPLVKERDAAKTLSITMQKNLERIFHNNSVLFDAYSLFMREYIDLNHMVKLKLDETKDAKFKAGISLNDLLHVGPNLLCNLFDLITSWRSYNLELVLAYQLKTVTHGPAYSPYLACRVIKQLASDYEFEFPLTYPILMKEIYMDDVLKWSSNDPDNLAGVPSTLLKSSPIIPLNERDSSVEVLGIVWYFKEDVSSFQVKFPLVPTSWTKRSVLSHIARLYDPLENLLSDWLRWFQEIRFLNQIRIPRWTQFSPVVQAIELHGYADASKLAYAAVLYLRVVANQEVYVSLLSAKTVAPLKTLSVPKLELCAAQLLSKLVQYHSQSQDHRVDAVHLWSDSKDVLYWLSSQPSRWPTFVANRCSNIMQLVSTATWHHVSGKSNPADIASRGVCPTQLLKHSLWFQGPLEIYQLSTEYPVFTSNENYDVPSKASDAVSHHQSAKPETWDL